MRAVLDANVIVSGIARYAHGSTAPARVLIAAVEGHYSLVTSEVIMGEVEKALSKAYFGERFDAHYLAEKLSDVQVAAEHTELTRRVEGVATHWQDDLVLSTALSGEADVLVTGDRELLELVHPLIGSSIPVPDRAPKHVPPASGARDQWVRRQPLGMSRTISASLDTAITITGADYHASNRRDHITPFLFARVR